MSSLKLALANAPANSEMFLFTDAAAKDQYLKNTVIALIERTQTVVSSQTVDRHHAIICAVALFHISTHGWRFPVQVNFMISGSSEVNRRKRRQTKITGSDARLYKELARSSGGQALEVTTPDLATAINVITRLSASVSLVIAAQS